jgi:hypothetical protein
MIVNGLSAVCNNSLYTAQQSASMVVNGLSAVRVLCFSIFKVDKHEVVSKRLHVVSIADKMNSSASYINNV